MDKSQFDRFDATVRGKIVDDGQGGYPGQCVSLVKRFITFNGWPYRHGDAINWQYNGNNGYKWFRNYPWNHPEVGDMVVFRIGQFGHIGIVGGANLQFMDVLSQNWPQGNGNDPANVTRFNYRTPPCVGWLRFVG